MRAIAEQTVITGQIAQLLSETPKAAQYEELAAYMRQSQASYITAVESSSKGRVMRLEHTINTWETAYLPLILGNVPTVPQPTPMSELTPTVVGTQDLEDVEIEDATQEQPTSSEQAGVVSPTTPRSLKRMQEKSLRQCCQRAVHEGGQTAQSSGAALRPFRSTG